MNLIKEIEETKKKLKYLKDKQNILKNVFKNLKIGDTVYEQQPIWIDYDYHPQIIEKIDLENLKIFVFEESINVRKWVSSFHLYDEKTKKFEYSHDCIF